MPTLSALPRSGRHAGHPGDAGAHLEDVHPPASGLEPAQGLVGHDHLGLLLLDHPLLRLLDPQVSTIMACMVVPGTCAGCDVRLVTSFPNDRGYYVDLPLVSESVYHQVQLSEYS